MSHECAQIWNSTSFDSDSFLLYFGKLGHKNIKRALSGTFFFRNSAAACRWASISIKMRASRRSHPLAPSTFELRSVNWPVSKLYSQQVSGRIKHRKRAQASSIFRSGVVCVLMPSTRTCQICLSCRKHYRIIGRLLNDLPQSFMLFLLPLRLDFRLKTTEMPTSVSRVAYYMMFDGFDESITQNGLSREIRRTRWRKALDN